MKAQYRKQVELLLDVLSIALQDPRVALKGGTAINLFHRDFPRLSVDIDLSYLPIEDRDTSFRNLHIILQEIKDTLTKRMNLNVKESVPLDGKKEAKLFVKNDAAEIKIEPNYTLRGGLFPPSISSLSKAAEKEFQRSANVQCLSFEDTYGGKLCAALDRQHPRDVYDVKLLLENEGISSKLKHSFIYYLISHNRPINELLFPNFKDIKSLYDLEFKEMAQVEVSLNELIEVQKKLPTEILKTFDENDKKFLFSFASNKPEWSLVHDQKIKDFPSVKWKMLNQEKMGKAKMEKYIEMISKVLGLN